MVVLDIVRWAIVGMRPRGSAEQPGDRLHGQEQPSGLLLKWDEAEVRVERFGSLVLGVNQNGHGGDLSRGPEAAPQSIHQQELPHAPTREGRVDRKPTQQRDGQLWIAWKLPRQSFRKFIRVDDRSRQRVVTQYPSRGWLDKNERGSHTLVGILARLLLQVAVQGTGAAGKPAALVALAEALDTIGS